MTLPGGVDLARLDLSLDWRVLAAGLAITVLTLAAAALLPVARFTHANLAGELVGASSTSSASSLQLRQVLLGLHVVATIIVLVAAGLFVRAVTRGFGNGSGFDVGRILFAQVQVVYPFMSSKEDIGARLAEIADATHRVADAIRMLPGVDDVAIGPLPISPDSVRSMLAPKTVETRGGRYQLRLGRLSGSPELLRVLGCPFSRDASFAPGMRRLLPPRWLPPLWHAPSGGKRSDRGGRVARTA